MSKKGAAKRTKVAKGAQASKQSKTTRHPSRRPLSSMEARQGSLHDWLEGVRQIAAAAETAGAPRGACLVQDPTGGPAMCLQVDKATCTLLKGQFVGGPC
jgi:hypothetical protein